MALYIALCNWTDQGIRAADATIERAKAARQVFQGAGARITDIYWTMGLYDVVVHFEAPDDETATRAAIAVGRAGNIRTTTLRAFAEHEMERVIHGLPKT